MLKYGIDQHVYLLPNFKLLLVSSLPSYTQLERSRYLEICSLNPRDSFSVKISPLTATSETVFLSVNALFMSYFV